MEQQHVPAAPSLPQVQPQPELLPGGGSDFGVPVAMPAMQVSPTVQLDSKVGIPAPMPTPQNPNGPVPVIKEKREYHLEYPTNSEFNPFLKNNGANKKNRGVVSSNQTTAEWLNLAAKSKERNSFSVEVIRRMPPLAADGSRLKQGRVIFSIQNLIPFSDLYNTIEVLNGGGDYSLNILNREHESVAGCSFSIAGEPKVTEEDVSSSVYNTGLGSQYVTRSQTPKGAIFSQRRFGNYTGVIGPEDEEIVKAHKMERLAMARASTFAADAKQLEAEDRFFKIANRREMAEVEKAKIEKELELKRDTMKFEAKEKREDREATTTKELILAMLAKMGQQNNTPDMSPFLESVKLVIEQSSMAQKQQMDTLLAVLKSSKENSNGKENQVMENMMTKFMDIAIGNAGSANQKYDKLMEALFMKKIESGDEISKINQYLDLFRKIQGPGDGDEEWINPDAGFWTNAGNAVLSLLKNVIQGAASGGGGGAILGLLNKVLQKPQGNTQFSDVELAPLAQALSKQHPQIGASLPLPQTISVDEEEVYQPGLRESVTPSVTRDVSAHQADQVSSHFSDPMNNSGSMLVDDPMGDSAVNPVQPVRSELHLSGKTNGAQPTVLRTTFGTESLDLPIYVNEVLEEMIGDLKSGRADHTWPETALGKWDASFLSRIVNAPDESTRLQIIREKSDPELFESFQAELLKGDWQAYKYFLSALQYLVDESRRRISYVR